MGLFCDPSDVELLDELRAEVIRLRSTLQRIARLPEGNEAAKELAHLSLLIKPRCIDI